MKLNLIHLKKLKMSSTFNRRQRRHKSKQEKELMDKYKLRIPTAQEVEQYIIDKAGH